MIQFSSKHPYATNFVLTDNQVTMLFAVMMIVIGIGIGVFLYVVKGFWYPMIVVVLYGIIQLGYELITNKRQKR